MQADPKNTIVRKTRPADMARLQEIFAIARRFMAETGNPNQWRGDYPTQALLKQDIESGDSYVVVCDGRIVGTFVLRGGEDPTYRIIREGCWPSDAPYATIHRIASSGERQGILHLALQFALQTYRHIRIDTHRDNRVMQCAVRKEGFVYCGIIRCWSGDERLAYQLSLPEQGVEPLTRQCSHE